MPESEPTVHERAAALADRISAELRRRGRWSSEPLDPARLVDMGAFGMNTLAAEEWIQFVLVPRVRELVAARGELPRESQISAWAARQFDGDPEADALVELLRDLDELAEHAATSAVVEAAAAGDLAGVEQRVTAGQVITPAALLGAVANGHRVVAEWLLMCGADPNAAGGEGIEPLFVAAAGGHPALATFLATPFEIAASVIERSASKVANYVAITEALLARGARPDRRVEPTGLTPLMVATFFGQREIAELLRAKGAEPLERDAWGRTADRFAVYPTIARVIRLCRRLPMVRAAYVAQIHDPVAGQFTSPVLGLELSAPLPADAFEGWPADDPIVAFGLADDAVSRLVRLTRPVYTPRPPLVIHHLAPGKRYRVLETIQELPRGATVVFRGFDDADNHYGRYEFEITSGQRVAVAGDFSSREHSPLAELHRYLEELD